jgi:hypothetical protein
MADGLKDPQGGCANKENWSGLFDQSTESSNTGHADTPFRWQGHLGQLGIIRVFTETVDPRFKSFRDFVFMIERG